MEKVKKAERGGSGCGSPARAASHARLPNERSGRTVIEIERTISVRHIPAYIPRINIVKDILSALKLDARNRN